ncbi:MAG: redoxin domain-containing protein [Anaerolineae bacterium]|nr:redoxin domain-containing protein [Anaerolineae bacterium]NUQ04619.1 redoxin domain-containing protein [Anaerolineae bacterium]
MTRFALLFLIILCTLALPAAAQDEPLNSPYAGRADLPAPEFPAGLDWLNVAEPLTIEALRGKIVILDFWTYGCINCIHMIPTLRALEEKYGDALVVIGIHSAKFDNEGETGNIRQIVQRYELHHPVINDSDFMVWQQFGARAWPTFMIIDPRGNLLAAQSGEIPFEAFDELLTGMVAFWEEQGELSREPLALALEGADTPPGLLAFPGKVLADADSNRLFIADTNHHRIVVADLTTAEVLSVIGSGERGFNDGGYGEASFDKPQGMALRGDLLYVADTENHAIRGVDLAAATVTTLAGTGRQGYGRLEVGARAPGLETDLSSPWDVTFGEDSLLYIAMAGPHQLWALYPDNTVGPVVGSGREAALNATLELSQLAQPSGLFYRDGLLYFADSESSTVRVADIPADRVETVAGTTDNNLFDFGDIDGTPGVSRLQHPLGVTGGATGPVYIADTYNSRIKALDPATNAVASAFGSGGSGGFRDGVGLEAAFDEPGGLSYADGKLYVADTNNHAIRVIDLATGGVSTLSFPNPERLQIAERVTVIGGNAAAGESLTLEPLTLAPGTGEIAIRIVLPEGYKINPDAPSGAAFHSAGAAVTLETNSVSFRETEFRLPVTLNAGTASLEGTISTYYCEALNETLCFFDAVMVTAAITVEDGAAGGVITIERAITPPAVAVGGLTG